MNSKGLITVCLVLAMTALGTWGLLEYSQRVKTQQEALKVKRQMQVQSEELGQVDHQRQEARQEVVLAQSDLEEFKLQNIRQTLKHRTEIDELMRDKANLKKRLEALETRLEEQWVAQEKLEQLDDQLSSEKETGSKLKAVLAVERDQAKVTQTILRKEVLSASQTAKNNLKLLEQAKNQEDRLQRSVKKSSELIQQLTDESRRLASDLRRISAERDAALLAERNARASLNAYARQLGVRDTTIHSLNHRYRELQQAHDHDHAEVIRLTQTNRALGRKLQELRMELANLRYQPGRTPRPKTESAPPHSHSHAPGARVATR